VGHSAVPLPGRLVAALLYGGDHAVLSHTTAAYVWSLIDMEPTRIHITVPGRRRSSSDVRVHHSRQTDRTTCSGLPVTPVERTLLDLASVVSRGQLRRALAEADYLKILEPRDVRAMLGKGRRGSRALGNALDSHLPQLAETLSVLEQRFLELSESAGITPPEVNVRVGGMRVDALWREQGLVVELDGAAAHGGWSQVSRDRERELVLRRRGFRVIRYTWPRITERPGDVIADLRRQLGGSAG
jgi:hypothetical protein